MHVAKRIAYLRAASGVSQEELAGRLGIAVKNLQRLEAGRQNLTLASIERVAAALRVDWRDIFLGDPVAKGDGRRATANARKLDGLAGPGRVVHAVEDQPDHAVPVTSLRAAAARLRAGREVEPLAWLAFTRSKPPQGAFVARVLGSSMAPVLADGVWTLFVPPQSRSVVGQVVLMAREVSGSGTPGYVLRRLARIDAAASGRHRATLRSDNPSFGSLVVDIGSPEELRVVSVVSRTLKPKGSERRSPL